MPQAYITFPSPGTGGICTDQPAWTIKGNQATVLINGVTMSGVLTQRRGWTYRYMMDVADSNTSYPMDSFAERFFPKAGRVGGVATQRSSVWIRDTTDAPHSGAWRKLPAPTQPFQDQITVESGAEDPGTANAAIAAKRRVRYLPRTYYNGELLLCSTDGFYPLLRYGGAYPNGTTFQSYAKDGANAVFTANKSSAHLTLTGTKVRNLYWHPHFLKNVSGSFAMSDSDGSDWGLAGFRATANTEQPTTMDTGLVGVAYPGCEIHSSGTVKINANGVLDFSGEHLASSQVLTMDNAPYRMMADAVLVERQAGVSYSIHPLVTPTNTGVDVPTTATEVPCWIMRRLAFRDVATHGGVLFGAGSLTKPSRVWYSEPGWDMAMPPNADVETWAYDNSNLSRGQGRMKWFDVPAEDTNEIIAILTTDSPLLVLKVNAVYGVYGAYPNYTQSLLSAGAGCLDVRGAITVDGYGTFWAGPNGIYSYKRGKVTDLTSDRINKEWRRRIRMYSTEPTSDNVVALGVSAGHLLVSATVGPDANPDSWTWACNLETGAWSEITNADARYFSTVLTNAGVEATLATLNDTAHNCPVNVQPMFFPEGPVQDGDGYYPNMVLETGSATDGDGTPDRQSRMTQVAVDYTIEDNPLHKSQAVVAVISTGGVDADPERVSELLGFIDGTDNPYSHKIRLRAGLSGRENRIRIAVTATGQENKSIRISEITALVRPRRAQV
jgi:hypothetical protein